MWRPWGWTLRCSRKKHFKYLTTRCDLTIIPDTSIWFSRKLNTDIKEEKPVEDYLWVQEQRTTTPHMVCWHLIIQLFVNDQSRKNPDDFFNHLVSCIYLDGKQTVRKKCKEKVCKMVGPEIWSNLWWACITCSLSDYK